MERLAEFTGRGAGLHVRVSGLATSIGELRARHPEQAEFADVTEGRLADVAAAIRVAEQMRAARRRAVHQDVAAELDTLDSTCSAAWASDAPMVAVHATRTISAPCPVTTPHRHSA